jgi:hypothetical protein
LKSLPNKNTYFINNGQKNAFYAVVSMFAWVSACAKAQSQLDPQLANTKRVNAAITHAKNFFVIVL